MAKWKAKGSSVKKKQLAGIIELISKMEANGEKATDQIYQLRDKLKAETSKNKFNARKVTIDGIEYDSTIEAKYKLFLDNINLPFEYHKKITLLPKTGLRYSVMSGMKSDENIQDMELEIDFLIDDFVLIDVKGGEATKTPEFVNKFKLLKNLYKERFVYVLVSSIAEFRLTLPSILLAVSFKRSMSSEEWTGYKKQFFSTENSFVNEVHRVNREKYL